MLSMEMPLIKENNVKNNSVCSVFLVSKLKQNNFVTVSAKTGLIANQI